MPTNYYSTLQVHTNAEQEVIEAAYKKLARKYHPDTNRASDTTLRMQRINEAYGVLADPEKRTLYDQENLTQIADTNDLRRQLELLESQLLNEQIFREEAEEELASVNRELRSEQARRKRAELKSARLAEELPGGGPRVKQHTPAFAFSDVAISQASHMQLQQKLDLVEKELAGERLHKNQIQEELSIAAAELTKERNERETSVKGLARLEQLLAAEREHRGKLEEEKRLAECERHAKEKVEALRLAEQAGRNEPEGHNKALCELDQARLLSAGIEIAEERFKREQSENELAMVRGIIRGLAKELRNIKITLGICLLVAVIASGW